MNASAFVDQARLMASALEDRETVAVGSRKIARERVARLAGVPASILYSLRYRAPKTIAADAYNNLCVAIERQAERQIGILQDEILSARTRCLGPDNSALGAAEIAAGHPRELFKRGA